MSVKLKPCPFCGGKARIMHLYCGLNQTSYVQCENYKCGVKGKEFQCSPSYSSDDKAIEAWNRRAENE